MAETGKKPLTVSDCSKLVRAIGPRQQYGRDQSPSAAARHPECVHRSMGSSHQDSLLYPSSAASALLAPLLSALADLFSNLADNRSSSVGTGGLSSTGTIAGAMIRCTTWRLFLEARQPEVIAITSPVLSESFGS